MNSGRKVCKGLREFRYLKYMDMKMKYKNMTVIRFVENGDIS